MRQRPPIIALAGPDRVGKSTAANEIASAMRRHDFLITVLIAGFGRPLREAARLLCEHPPKSEGWRDWMRAAGETARARHGEDVLISALEANLRDRHDYDNWNGHLAIIDDLRTDGEAKWVHANKGVVIELQRDGVAYSGHSLDSRLHPTLIDAVVPVGDPTETARHILRLTGWLE